MSKKTIEYAKKLVSQMTIDEKISQMLYGKTGDTGIQLVE